MGVEVWYQQNTYSKDVPALAETLPLSTAAEWSMLVSNRGHPGDTLVPPTLCGGSQQNLRLST